MKKKNKRCQVGDYAYRTHSFFHLFAIIIFEIKTNEKPLKWLICSFRTAHSSQLSTIIIILRVTLVESRELMVVNDDDDVGIVEIILDLCWIVYVVY